MTSKLFEEKIISEFLKICVLHQKVQGKESALCFWIFKKMQWLQTWKYTIFMILLIFQNLWNPINVIIKNIYKNIYWNVFSTISQSLMGCKQIKVWDS